MNPAKPQPIDHYVAKAVKPRCALIEGDFTAHEVIHSMKHWESWKTIVSHLRPVLDLRNILDHERIA